jgi:hypothetical protein
MVMNPPANSRRGRRGRNVGNLPTTATPTRTSLTAGRLQTEEAVLEDILAQTDGNYNNYVDAGGNPYIVEISRGQLQYTPTPNIVWPNAATLRNAIDNLATEKRIKAERERAERIANAVGSAVVVIPTDTRAFVLMAVVAVGLGTLFINRKPWTSSTTIAKITDTVLYGGTFLLSLYILVKMSNAKSAAKGAAKQDRLIATP